MLCTVRITACRERLLPGDIDLDIIEKSMIFLISMIYTREFSLLDVDMAMIMFLRYWNGHRSEDPSFDAREVLACLLIASKFNRDFFPNDSDLLRSCSLIGQRHFIMRSITRMQMNIISHGDVSLREPCVTYLVEQYMYCTKQQSLEAMRINDRLLAYVCIRCIGSGLSSRYKNSQLAIACMWLASCNEKGFETAFEDQYRHIGYALQDVHLAAQSIINLHDRTKEDSKIDIQHQMLRLVTNDAFVTSLLALIYSAQDKTYEKHSL